MNLQTIIPLEKQSVNLIDYHSNVLFLGSCFSDNMGKKFDYFKLSNLQNPFGILFQPKAIENLIVNAVDSKEYTEKDVFFQNEHWHCFDAHSKLSNPSKVDLLRGLNEALTNTHLQIKKSTHVIITLGTAWVYRFFETGAVVANCHKVPQKHFQKEILSIEAVSESLSRTSEAIKSINPEVTLVFTVSPVRHLKDGFIENMQSKSHLIAAIRYVLNRQSSIKKQHSFYFPAYEIMMDELRDYRFYKEDMKHPNQTAINYIWEKFQKVWLSSEALKTMTEVEVVQKGLQHKPFHPNSEGHLKFLRNLEARKLKLQSQYSDIQF